MAEYKLTISILASNRKDTLEKTLQSIKPIMDNVSCELIVTDTGCDEELLNYIRTFTNKIIKFDWCNDFSKARNVGLKMSKGEWFFYLDDDEWFEDVTDIIDFFNSSESEEYDKVEYVQRNYHDIEGTHFTDAWVDRGARITKELQFVDKIHEHFNINSGNTKALNAYVHHFGYAFKNEEEKNKHVERNLTLLMNQADERPFDLRTYAHILQEYIGMDDYEACICWSDRALERADFFDIRNYRYIGVLYTINAYAYLKLGQSKKAMQVAKDVLDLEQLSLMAKGMLYYVLCMSMRGNYNPNNMEDVKRIASYVNGYLKIRNYYINNYKQSNDDSTIFVRHTFDEAKVAEVVMVGKELAAAYGR